MKAVWANQAQRDRSDIYDFIESANPAAAAALDQKILHSVELLSSNPLIGRVGRAPGTREFVVRSHYIIVYRLSQSMLHVLRVMHTARHRP